MSGERVSASSPVIAAADEDSYGAMIKRADSHDTLIVGVPVDCDKGTVSRMWDDLNRLMPGMLVVVVPGVVGCHSFTRVPAASC